MVGFQPTTQKNHGPSTTPFVKELSGVLVRLTTCKRLTNSLPQLSLITPATRTSPFDSPLQAETYTKTLFPLRPSLRRGDMKISSKNIAGFFRRGGAIVESASGVPIFKTTRFKTIAEIRPSKSACHEEEATWN